MHGSLLDRKLQVVQPDILVFELCKVRTNLLQLDEETILILVKAKIKKLSMAWGGGKFITAYQET